MPGLYGIGNYGVNLYSASAVFDGEAVINVTIDYSVDESRLRNNTAIVAAGVSFSAEAKAIFGAIASVQASTDLSAEAKVVHVYRGEAHIIIQTGVSSSGSRELAGFAEVIVASEIVIQDYYAGPFWGPEEIEGSWVPEVPPEGIWVPEPPFPEPWG